MGVQTPSPVIQCWVDSGNLELCKTTSLLSIGLFISPSHNIVLRGRGFCSSSVANIIASFPRLLVDIVCAMQRDGVATKGVGGVDSSSQKFCGNTWHFSEILLSQNSNFNILIKSISSVTLLLPCVHYVYEFSYGTLHCTTHIVEWVSANF